MSTQPSQASSTGSDELSPGVIVLLMLRSRVADASSSRLIVASNISATMPKARVGMRCASRRPWMLAFKGSTESWRPEGVARSATQPDIRRVNVPVSEGVNEPFEACVAAVEVSVVSSLMGGNIRCPLAMLYARSTLMWRLMSISAVARALTLKRGPTSMSPSILSPGSATGGSRVCSAVSDPFGKLVRSVITYDGLIYLEGGVEAKLYIDR